MTFEEANKLARKIFVNSSGSIYNKDYTYEEYTALHEAFTGGQPKNPCYYCIYRNSCVYHEYVNNVAGCNYRIEGKH